MNPNEDVIEHHENTTEYPPYNIYVHVTLLTIITAYIPVIIVSSSFVIAAVIYVKKLHNSHNYILLAISAADLFVALIIIPSYVLLGIQATREFIFDHIYLCRVVHTLQDCIESTELWFLTILGLDTFLQIKFPIQYRTLSTKKNVKICFLTIVVIELFVSDSIYDLIIYRDFTCINVVGLYRSWGHVVKQKVTFITLLTVCFLSGVYVRVVSWRRGHTKSEKITMVLLMLFIIFYTPTVMMLFQIKYLEKSQRELYLYISRAIRYLCPLTNGIFICISRRVYKTAFSFFIRTNPRHWNKIDKNLTLLSHHVIVPFEEKDVFNKEEGAETHTSTYEDSLNKSNMILTEHGIPQNSPSSLIGCDKNSRILAGTPSLDCNTAIAR